MKHAILPYRNIYPDYYKNGYPPYPFDEYPFYAARGYVGDNGCIPEPFGNGFPNRSVNYSRHLPWRPYPENIDYQLPYGRSLSPSDFGDLPNKGYGQEDISIAQRLTRCAHDLMRIDEKLGEHDDQCQQEALCTIYYCMGLLGSLGVVSKEEIEQSLDGRGTRAVEKGPCARLGERIDRDIRDLLDARRGKGSGEKIGEYMDMVRECITGGK
ncbi:MAG: hypothetical protein AB3N16_10335 [Flavobacteriaceae bacterium]